MSCTTAETTKGLAILFSASDDGTRPFACDGSIPYWTNPNIWLDHPSSLADNGTAVVNVVNTIKVRVSNLSGTTINNINIQAWVCDYTMGVAPSSAIPGTGEMDGFIPTIAAGGTAVASCAPTWTPTSTQELINGGHVCIGANVYGDGDGQALPPAGFNFCCNARHGQRNIMIRTVPPGGHRRFIDIELLAHGLIDGGVTTVNVRRTTGRFAFTSVDRAFLLASQPFRDLLANPEISQRFGSLSGNLLRTNVSEAVRANSNPTSLLRNLTPAERPFRLSPFKLATSSLATEATAAERIEVANGINGLRLQLRPKQHIPVKLHVEFSQNERVGNIHTFDFFQSDAQHNVIGGARVIVLIV